MAFRRFATKGAPAAKVAYVVLSLSLVLNTAWISAWAVQRGLGFVYPARGPAASQMRTQRRFVNPASSYLIDSACGGPWITRLHDHLRNIVLVINVNYDFVAYNTSDFLRILYGRFFYDVVVIGPNEIHEIGVEARGTGYWRHQWCNAYFYLPNVMARYPEVEGFLWTNDDVVINYWHLLRANKSKLWLPDTPSCHICQGWALFDKKHGTPMPDGWSDSPWRQRAARLAFQGMDSGYREQYNRSIWPHRGAYNKRVVDVFYVPQRLRLAFAFDLMPTFREFGVCSELGVPIMFSAMEHPKEYDPIFGGMEYQWGRGANYDPRNFWTANLTAYHHWKVARRSAQINLVESLSTVDGCLRRFLPLLNSSSPVSLMDAVARAAEKL